MLNKAINSIKTCGIMQIGNNHCLHIDCSLFIDASKKTVLNIKIRNRNAPKIKRIYNVIIWAQKDNIYSNEYSIVTHAPLNPLSSHFESICDSKSTRKLIRSDAKDVCCLFFFGIFWKNLRIECVYFQFLKKCFSWINIILRGARLIRIEIFSVFIVVLNDECSSDLLI